MPRKRLCHSCKLFGRRLRCIKHGGYPLCQEVDCTTPVIYIYGEVRNRCFKHGGYPKCSSCGLFNVKKLLSLCGYCKPQQHRSFLVKERNLKTYLDSQPDIPKFDYNRSTKVCTGFRPDFRSEQAGWTLFIECDEHQHKNYNKSEELERMKSICADEGWPRVFIRWNPDTYKLDKKIQNISIEVRYSELKASILRNTEKNWGLQGRPHQSLILEYMYYDNKLTT